MKRKVLLVDDDSDIRNVVRVLLESEGYAILEAANGADAVETVDGTVDLIILDVMMPGCDGYTACMEIRKKSTAPILFLTAKSQDSDKTMGFSSGGDDYLAKPFSYPELIARVKALLRRCYVYCQGQPEDSIISLPGLTIDPKFNEVKKDGRETLLTDLEYRILLLLAKNRGKIFTIQNIYESVWQEPYFFTSNNTVMVHIRNLRKKLEDNPQNPKYIKNVWGKGYRIE